MRVVALISGGKDSCFNMMQCVAAGHEIVALANLQPPQNDEMDSYMYQTVGHDGIDMYAESMGLPLFRRVIAGNALIQEKEYSPTIGDEVEDLFELLSDVRRKVEFDGISVGAILSDYQRIRVENVCKRLNCVSLAYLWRRDQSELLQEMVDCGVNAIIIKTASLGLNPDIHLGQSIAEMQAHLLESKGKYGINVCGEGGEYETFTLDCPLFRNRIVLDEYEKVIHSNDAFAPVGYLRLKKVHLIPKDVENESESPSDSQKSSLNCVPVKAPLDYLNDLVECTEAECCDGHEDLCAGKGSGDKEGDHCRCCKKDGSKKKASKVSETIEEILKNGDVPATPSQTDNDVKCQEIRRENLPFPENTVKVTSNSGGWVWIMGIQGRLENGTSSPLRQALCTLRDLLEERGLTFRDVISICMYVSSMDDYAQYNSEYNEFFESQPPVRVCVEAPLSAQVPILMEAVAYSLQPGTDGSTKQCMHVQGISHWAPANIGPYSQAIWVGDVIYVAGQIGLVPGSMTLVPGGAKMECKLALRSLNRIIKATDPKVELRDVVQGICFVTDLKYIEDCRHEWEKLTNNAIVEYLVVPGLPRNARVEWQMWVHKHNTAFEYEETGCYVGSGVKVRIIRRWNYENRVSAIVCRATISKEEASFGTQEMQEMTEYALNKLRGDTEKSVECSLRVFYKTGTVNPSQLFSVLEPECSKHAVSFCILPVCSLMTDNAIVSFCGVRH